ncbi:DUF6270 domain-containing protein [Jannaschia sp. M317]|uniref:DUF6270 domain-containing protein n=1 Tax=Jannaschia sp. M317 TaxID=2867011 RepID=UPI0021A893F6|nr:DUF6270 domain-containing protein [Jannaschia sp. M317]UWQ16598.1 hypothetical protein K3551_11815 [Jannaschia sp. M317]
MTPIQILGSCATRDAFEYPFARDFDVQDYTARTSLASLACPPRMEPDILEAIGSNFQRRMVHRDMTKAFWKNLAGYTTGAFIVDLVDDRFRLLQFADGSAHTGSTEYQKARRAHEVPSVKTLLRGAPGYNKLWGRGLRLLHEALEKEGPKPILLVNCVFFARTDNERVNADNELETMNRFLDYAYKSFANKFGDECLIRYPKGLLQSDSDHKWGKAPFHYTESAYEYFISELTARFA